MMPARTTGWWQQSALKAADELLALAREEHAETVEDFRRRGVPSKKSAWGEEWLVPFECLSDRAKAVLLTVVMLAVLKGYE